MIDYQRNKRGPPPRSSNFANVKPDPEDEGVLAESTIVWVTMMATPLAFLAVHGEKSLDDVLVLFLKPEG